MFDISNCDWYQLQDTTKTNLGSLQTQVTKSQKGVDENKMALTDLDKQVKGHTTNIKEIEEKNKQIGKDLEKTVTDLEKTNTTVAEHKVTINLDF